MTLLYYIQREVLKVAQLPKDEMCIYQSNLQVYFIHVISTVAIIKITMYVNTGMNMNLPFTDEEVGGSGSGMVRILL